MEGVGGGLEEVWGMGTVRARECVGIRETNKYNTGDTCTRISLGQSGWGEEGGLLLVAECGQ